MRRRETAEDIDGVLFFGLLRAASEEDDFVISDAGELAEGPRARIVAIRLCAVIFKRTGDDDAICECAERAKAIGRLVVLSRDNVDLPQYRGDERADATVPGETVIAHSAVRDRNSGAVVLSGLDEVRPQLQFGEHQD